jgi:hypothetical protein
MSGKVRNEDRNGLKTKYDFGAHQMVLRSLIFRIGSGVHSTVIRGLTICLVLAAGLPSCAQTPPPGAQNAPGTKVFGGMAHMSGHMYMTSLRTLKAGDQQRADAVVVAARAAMEPYQDYRKALADGYQIFLPNVPQPLYHFTKSEYAREARQHFDPLKPTSLLYKKTPDGGYKLIGAMYTDRVDANEDELNNRIPLSVAMWHQHTNFCKGPTAQTAEYIGPDAKFGLLGSIHTKEACEAAAGQFYPHVFGWMVHVYPYETDPKKIWSTNDQDEGHDNMDHSAMPGMNMN